MKKDKSALRWKLIEFPLKGLAIEIAPKYIAVVLERMSMNFPKLEVKRINENEFQKSRKKAGRTSR